MFEYSYPGGVRDRSIDRRASFFWLLCGGVSIWTYFLMVCVVCMLCLCVSIFCFGVVCVVFVCVCVCVCV